MPVTLYLRAPLFVPREGGAAPARAMVLKGHMHESGHAGGITVTVNAWADQDGRTLDAPGKTLFLPMAKIDHVAMES